MSLKCAGLQINPYDPRIFYHTLEKLNLNADEVVHIGDTDADIDGAKAAGIIPVLIDRNFTDSLSGDYIKERMLTQINKRKVPADCRVIRSLSELQSLEIGAGQAS
jgi:FMN phosphatase YigB (HAD superfamily)